MGVRQFNAVVDVTVRASKRQTSPDRWDAEDPWFAQQHQRN